MAEYNIEDDKWQTFSIKQLKQNILQFSSFVFAPEMKSTFVLGGYSD